MWYKFAGRKEIEQRFGKETYEIIKSIQSNLQEIAATFVHNILQKDPKIISRGLIPQEQIIETFKVVANLTNRNYIQVYKKNSHIYIKSKNEEFFFLPDQYLEFTEKIDFFKSLLTPDNIILKEQTESDLNIPENTITVKKANNVIDAINYGMGTTWCISQPSNTMYQSYRSQKGSTFYFVFDTTRPEGDPLRRVVVDMTKNGVELTDLDNDTGRIAEFGRDDDAYMEYLENHGVDLNQFKHEPFTKKEKEEYEFLANRIYNLSDFVSLNEEAKRKNIDNAYSKYIGFGHILSKEQFKFLIGHNAKHLINQYVTTGNSIHKENLNFLNNQQLRTYMRSRNMMYEHYKGEYVNFAGEFNPEQMLYNLNDNQFTDEVFFNNLLKENTDPIIVLDKLVDLNYRSNEYNDLINNLLQKKYSQYQLDQITWRLLARKNPTILDRFLNLHPEQIELIKEELNDYHYWSWTDDSNLINYLYGKIKQPQLFLNIATLRLLNYDFKDGMLHRLIQDGYVDQLMENILTYNYDLEDHINFLLDEGASLEKAWELAKGKLNYKMFTKNALHIFRKMKEKHHDLIQEYLDSPIKQKEEYDKINEAFNLKNYFRKLGKKLGN